MYTLAPLRSVPYIVSIANPKDCMRNEENNNPLDNKNYSFQ
jgi:hypothetical protein